MWYQFSLETREVLRVCVRCWASRFVFCHLWLFYTTGKHFASARPVYEQVDK
jgi:hypothetical protein